MTPPQPADAQAAPPAAPAAPFDVILFPIVDWDYRFQRPQHLARQFARAGHRVFYLSTHFIPEFAWEPECREIEPNLCAVRIAAGERPLSIYSGIPDELQTAAMEGAVRMLRHRFRIGAALAMVDYPFWRPLVQRLDNLVVVYDRMDDYASFANAGPPVRELEQPMIAAADLVVCSSAHLQELTAKAGRESALIRNGVEPEHYYPPPAALALAPNGRTAGCHGAISEWTDIALLEYAARALPDVRFVMVGGVERASVSPLRALPNVLFTGEVPYAELPRYVHAFDVGLLAYRIGGYALASDPMKVYEYLSAGKPVVAVRFPEIERLDGLVRLAATKEEFVEAIRLSLDDRDPAAAARRRDFARPNTWAARADEYRRAAAPLFPKVSVIVLCHNQRWATEATLAGLEEFTLYPNVEYVLVDNASTDGTAGLLDAFAARRNATVILHDRNLGFSAGNNSGARAATGDYLVFLNNDVYVTSGWTGGLLAHFRRNPRLGLLGPVTNSTGNESAVDIGGYENMEEMAALARRYTREHRGGLTPMRILHFFCVMIPRAVWNAVGELDENYGTGLFEDDDYSLRVRAAGYEIACAEDVYVHHHQSASFGALPPAAYDELFARNRRYFESKWGPWIPPRHRDAPGGPAC